MGELADEGVDPTQRQMVVEQSETERSRANLARYFSPNLVDELAGADEPLGTPRRQNAAALFTDMVGFTTAAADLPPEEVMGLDPDTDRDGRFVAASARAAQGLCRVVAGILEARDLEGLQPIESQSIRGRDGRMVVWTR